MEVPYSAHDSTLDAGDFRVVFYVQAVSPSNFTLLSDI